MCSRRTLAAALVLLAAAQPALAHGEDAPAEAVFDPLRLSLHAYLSADGNLTDAIPAPGAVPLPASPPVAPAAAGLPFTLAVPVRFVPGQGIEVALHLRAEKPVLTRDADGNGLELALMRNGEEVPGAARRVPLGDALLAPGATASARAVLQAPGVTFAKGDDLALVVRPLMPGLQEEALFVLVGGEAASSVDIHDMRVPTLADLELQEADLTQFFLATEEFAPPRGAPSTVLRVLHDRVEVVGAVPPGVAYLVLRGEEPAAEAAAHSSAHREGRIEAAHEFRLGATLVRVHPGVGVVVPVPTSPASIAVGCARNCPSDFVLTLRSASDARAGSSPSASDEPQSVLIPPPRSTVGIPVSQDAPQEEKRLVPQPSLLALAGLAAGGAAFGFWRTRWKD